MRWNYWDWKLKLQMNLGRLITSGPETEMIWELYAEGRSPHWAYHYIHDVLEQRSIK